jgi:putative DNA primase/helicase
LPPDENNSTASDLKASSEACASIKRLSELAPIEYDLVREKEAKSLGIRTSTLDKEVRKARNVDPATAGQSLQLDEPEPWPDAVDGEALLKEIAATVRSYVVAPRHVDSVVALWVAHAHAFQAFEHTPRLNITAPVKQCGKTVLLDLLQTLTPKAQRTENLSTAVLFRVIDKCSPTLLIDEYDSFLKGNEELRGALNSGHRRGGTVMRCEGDDNEIRTFNTFAPVALAGIGILPGTLQDRSIIVRMARARIGEVPKRFDSRKTAHEDELNSKLARWAGDHFSELKSIDPELPSGAFNRVADNWRPLFAIAQVIGGEWPEIARQAFEAMTAADDDAESLSIQLLADIRTILNKNTNGKIPGKELVAALLELEDRPWGEFNNGKAITPAKLARMLRPFGIISGTRRLDSEITLKGYERSQFNESFSRYLPENNVTPSQPNRDAAFWAIQKSNENSGVTFSKTSQPAPDKESDGVTFLKGGDGECEHTNSNGQSEEQYVEF